MLVALFVATSLFVPIYVYMNTTKRVRIHIAHIYQRKVNVLPVCCKEGFRDREWRLIRGDPMARDLSFYANKFARTCGAPYQD